MLCAGAGVAATGASAVVEVKSAESEASEEALVVVAFFGVAKSESSVLAVDDDKCEVVDVLAEERLTELGEISVADLEVGS